jgi:hypothetical protein
MMPRPGSAFSRASAHPLAGRTILQIIPELEAGGAERTAIDVAAGLAEVGARALVASEGGRLVGELQANGGVWIPFPARTKNPLSMLAECAPARARRLPRTRRPHSRPLPGSGLGRARGRARSASPS